MISRSEARYSPRHRHTFEQFRYQLEGTADYSRTGTLETGILGYFPEAVHYGPLCLQCGGASGGGYISRGEQLAAAKELQSMGTFKDGVFHRNPELPGKHNVEGSRAIWEHITQRPLEYPEPRYETPFLMKPDNFDWRPVKDTDGVCEKPMGVFTERNMASAFVKLDSNISYDLGSDGRDIYFVLKGVGTAASEPYRWGTTFYLDPEEIIALTAIDDTELIHFRLPDLDDLKAREIVGE